MSLCSSQVVLLTCEQQLNPIEVEVVFQSFPSTKYSDAYKVTCRTASNQLVRTMACLLWFSLINWTLFILYNLIHGHISAGVCGAH